MQDTHWHWEFNADLLGGVIFGMLLVVLGLVVATQNGDAAFWHARWRKDRINVVLEFTMAVIVTLASAGILAFLLPYY